MEIRITGMDPRVAARTLELLYSYGYHNSELLYGKGTVPDPYPIIGLVTKDPKAALVALAQVVG